MAVPRMVGDQTPTSTDWNLMADEIEGTNPRCIVSRTAVQALTTGVSTTVQWTTEVEDTDSMFTATSDTITIRTSGTYQVAGGVIFLAAANGTRGAWIRHNGVEIEGSGFEVPGTSAGYSRSRIGTEIVAAAGDTITVAAYQNSGGNLDLNGCRLIVHKIS